MAGRVLPFRARAARAATPAAPGPLSAIDQERFRRTVLAHLDGAYDYARWLCRDPALAEDLVQEAFLRALRGFAGFRGDDPRGWLFAIVRNCVFSAARSGRPLRAEPAEAEALADEADTPETALLRQSEATAVRGAIEALPEPFRETLVLRELQELSYRQIAELTGAPIGTVMSRLARARALLAHALGAHEEPRP
jgi:RNA polymerase sigma-70 factor (ECF subfamily)